MDCKIGVEASWTVKIMEPGWTPSWVLKGQINYRIWSLLSSRMFVFSNDPIGEILGNCERWFKDYESLDKFEWEVIMKEIKPTLVKIGEDIPLHFISKFATARWLGSSGKFNSSSMSRMPSQRSKLEKDTFFVFTFDKDKSQPVNLFEYPIDHSIAPLKPKTEFWLHLASTENFEIEDFDSEFFVGCGVKIVKKFTSDNAGVMLERRYDIFLKQPTATNTVLVFQIMDAVIMDKAKSGHLDSMLEGPNEKTIDRIEKLKSLALGTNHAEERKLAVAKCFQSFKKLMGA